MSKSRRTQLIDYRFFFTLRSSNKSLSDKSGQFIESYPSKGYFKTLGDQMTPCVYRGYIEYVRTRVGTGTYIMVNLTCIVSAAINSQATLPEHLLYKVMYPKYSKHWPYLLAATIIVAAVNIKSWVISFTFQVLWAKIHSKLNWKLRIKLYYAILSMISGFTWCTSLSTRNQPIFYRPK